MAWAVGHNTSITLEEKTDVPYPLVLRISQVLQVVLSVLILSGLHSLYNNLITIRSFQLLSG
jgi:hypothetical protein